MYYEYKAIYDLLEIGYWLKNARATTADLGKILQDPAVKPQLWIPTGYNYSRDDMRDDLELKHLLRTSIVPVIIWDKRDRKHYLVPSVGAWKVRSIDKAYVLDKDTTYALNLLKSGKVTPDNYLQVNVDPARMKRATDILRDVLGKMKAEKPELVPEKPTRVSSDEVVSKDIDKVELITLDDEEVMEEVMNDKDDIQYAEKVLGGMNFKRAREFVKLMQKEPNKEYRVSEFGNNVFSNIGHLFRSLAEIGVVVRDPVSKKYKLTAIGKKVKAEPWKKEKIDDILAYIKTHKDENAVEILSQIYPFHDRNDKDYTWKWSDSGLSEFYHSSIGSKYDQVYTYSWNKIRYWMEGANKKTYTRMLNKYLQLISRSESVSTKKAIKEMLGG